MSTGMLGKLPLSAVRGPKDHLDNLLAGSDGEDVLAELKKFVKRQPCWEVNPLDALSEDMKREDSLSNFTVWKTITLGLHKSGDEYRKAMELAKNKIGQWAGDILGKAEFTCATQVSEVDLVVLSCAGLGFKEGAKYHDICARALSMDLELCPAEVGPALRLAYKNQPRGGCLIIVMNAIAASGGDPSVFHVEHNNNAQWLHGYHGRPGNFWSSYYCFVFVKPRK